MKRTLCFLILILGSLPVQAQNPRPELALQIGHMARVSVLASSPSGALLASGGADKTAKIWDAPTGTLRFSLPHPAAVLAVGFSSDSLLATADASGTVRQYDALTGALRGQNEGGQVEMSAAAFSQDGKKVALAFSNGKIELREVASGKVLATLDGHPTRVLSLAFSPDGNTLASTSDAVQQKTENPELARPAGDVRLWSVIDGELIKILRGHALAVYGVAWSNDGTKLVSVGESGTAVLWNASTFERIDEFNTSEGQGRATSVAFSPDDSRLVVGWRAGIKEFDLNDAGKPVWARKAERATPTLAVLQDGRVLAGGDEGELQLLDAATGTASPTRGRISPLTTVRASKDGHWIVCAATDGVLNLWDGQRGTLLRSWQGHLGAARDVAFSPDGTLLASVGDDKVLRFWELPQGRLKRILSSFSGAVTAVAFSADGKTVAAGADAADGLEKVTLWNVADGSPLATLDEPRGTIHSLAFAPNGSLTAACGNWDTRGDVLLWDATHKIRRKAVLRGAHAVAVSPDGKRFAAVGSWLDETQDYASAGDVAQLWSLRAGEVTREMTAKAKDARALAVGFGLDSRLLVTGSRDGAVRVWNGSDDAPSQTLLGHSGPVNSVFITGASTILSAGSDGTVKLWEGATGRNLATLLTLDDMTTKGNAAVGSLLSPQWLALTPEGYFDGSPAAGRYVQWRLGPDVFPVEAFEVAFRRPEALGAALRGENLDVLSMGARFTAGKAVPPQVTIGTPKAGQNAQAPLTVQVTATDDKNLKSLQLFVNGRPVASKTLKGAAKPLEIGRKPLEMSRKPLEIGRKPLEMGRKPVEEAEAPVPSSHGLSWDISLDAPLPPADGGAGLTLKALVTDGDGLQGTDEIRLKRLAQNGGFGTLRVLSIGVSRYANPNFNLRFAANDANAFAELWNQRNGGLFEKVAITTLTDARATSADVQAAMRQIAGAAAPEDVVIIFLSGHGVARGDNEFFFATHNIDLEKIPQTSVPWKAFQEVLSGSKARRVLLFLDACHSGGALGARQAGNEEMASQLVKNAGAIVFSSSLGSQISFELETLGHGAFTKALIDGIGEGEADLDAGTGKDGTINAEELLTFLRARVPQLTEGAQMPACPLLRDFGEPFPLAKVK